MLAFRPTVAKDNGFSMAGSRLFRDSEEKREKRRRKYFVGGVRVVMAGVNKSPSLVDVMRGVRRLKGKREEEARVRRSSKQWRMEEEKREMFGGVSVDGRMGLRLRRRGEGREKCCGAWEG
ncbi:hypothetical protein HAX54_018821 [Datura stramonium]|uniref:Uncharacterized protein n=1 Tax=Datura stramonium TaxID=4076 RepID=A0ABS8UQ49_DATST|nr:hypothetical protein [Datura stramonium]